MKTLKFTKPALLILFIAFLFTACKKEQSTNGFTPAVNPIVGKWVGEFNKGDGTPATYYSFNIKATGKFELIDATGNLINFIDAGVWTLTGTNFTGNYINPQDPKKTIHVTAIFNSTTKKLTDGTYNYSAATPNILSIIEKTKRPIK